MNFSKKRQLKDNIFKYIINFSIIFCFGVLLWLILSLLKDSFNWLNFDFIINFPSRFPEKAGALPGIVGSFFLIILTSLFVIPIGICAALYLEEYVNKRNKWYGCLDLCIYNLSAIPSIIYGILGLSIFSKISFFKGTIISGAFVLSLMILPVIIISSREAIKAVPIELKEAAYSLGMTKLQMIKAVVLPISMPRCLSGTIIALSRAIGESAPLIVVGAVTIVTVLPLYLDSSYTALPILIYYWSGQPLHEFQHVAAAGSILLIIILIIINGIAIKVKNSFSFYKK